MSWATPTCLRRQPFLRRARGRKCKEGRLIGASLAEFFTSDALPGEDDPEEQKLVVNQSTHSNITSWKGLLTVLSGLPPSRITQGQSPPTRRGAGPYFLESRSSPPPQHSKSVHAERPHCALRSRCPHRQEFEAGLKGASRNKLERFPMQPFHAIAPLRDRAP